jgi:hypothetical protein
MVGHFREVRVSVQFLCEAYTTGGPVAVLQHRYRSLWDGEEDYFRAVKQPVSGCLQVALEFKGSCALCLFRHSSDGNFHVYHDRGNLLVLSEISADEGYEVRRNLPPVARAVVGKPPVMLRGFGGKVLIFDAAIPGNAIDLHEHGCGQATYGTESPIRRYDMALVEAEVGDWEALELYSASQHVSFSGVWFRRTR